MDSPGYLGIEIGGTKLQFGVGDGRTPRLEALDRCDIDRSRGAEGILEAIADVTHRLLQHHPISAIGFGFGGPVNARAGRVITSHQVDGWDDFNLAGWCDKHFGLPILLGNDCNAAALGEARFGAGKNGRRVFYVTVGTGIGGGFVADSVLQGENRPAATEIGHLRLGLDATHQRDTLESIAAGPGIEAAARETLHSTPLNTPARTDLLARCDGKTDRLTAKIIGEAAGEGNRLAATVIGDAMRALGWGIAQAITLFAADIVVVGGGVSLMGEELFYNPLRHHVARYVFPPLKNSYSLLPPALGETVVLHGALALAHDAFNPSSTQAP